MVKDYSTTACSLLRASKNLKVHILHQLDFLYTRSVLRLMWLGTLQAADLFIATKRRLYQEISWSEFFSKATFADMDYVQHSLAPGMRLGTEVYIDDTPKSLYSLDMSTDTITELLVRALESTLITSSAQARVFEE